MKKSEIYLFFITLFIGLSIFMVALFKYTKPSNISLNIDDDINTYNNLPKSKDYGWIDKISKNNQKFAYPVVIYKLKI